MSVVSTFRASTCNGAIRYRDRQGLSPQEDRALDMWEHCLKGLEADPLSLHLECDWVAKYRLIDRYRDRHRLSLHSPAVSSSTSSTTTATQPEPSSRT